MNQNFEKYGLAAVMVLSFLTALFTEGRSMESSIIFFSLAMISFGILALMLSVDWWAKRRRQDKMDDEIGGGETKKIEEM